MAERNSNVYMGSDLLLLPHTTVGGCGTLSLREYDSIRKDPRSRTIPKCRRCNSFHICDNLSGFFVCRNCGLCTGDISYDLEPDISVFHAKTYKRIFYFNERCSRWLCREPEIDPGCWKVIVKEAQKKKYGNPRFFTKRTISKILRSVKISEKFSEKYKSKKFKQNLMTRKRFYDKHFEKWKSIIWKLNNKRPNLPPIELVSFIKQLFLGMQKPFEENKHSEECDRRPFCHKYFPCWNNFINYDFVFRKLLQVADLKFGFTGCFDLYKNEFSLVSQKIRDTKLRPFFQIIAVYNKWPCPNNED